MTITVTDNAPVAKNDTYSIVHGQFLSATTTSTGVLSNDTDADGDSLTASIVTGVQHGTLSFNANGQFTYTPNAGYYGTDTFTYQDYDGPEWSGIATVTIAVNENPPIASNDTYTVLHGVTLSATSTYTSVLYNDSDPDNDSLTASLVSNVQHGTLSLGANGQFTYTPAAGFAGTDTFTYKDYDGVDWSGVATVTITVTDNAPIAKNDTYSILHGQVLSATTTYTGVLYNDSDADNDSLTASLVTGVQHGTLSLNTNGQFTYTPNAGFYGTDTFTYQDYDGAEWSGVATVTIAVNENPPTAKNDSYTVVHGQTLTVSFTSTGILSNDLDPDGDSITASLVSNVQHGTLSLGGNGTFTYTPTVGFYGTDTFTYKDFDGLEWSALATVTIAVTDNAPIAKNDSYSVAHGQVLSVTSTFTGVLYNDTDLDGDSLTASIVTGVQHGTLTFNANGLFTYTPNAGYYGTDTFTYQDYDGAEWSGVATVTIAVTENPPVSHNDSYTVTHNQTLSITATSSGVLGNDTDADGDSLTASLVSNVQHGTLSLSPNGTFTYTPNAGFIGTDTFTYKDYDGLEWSTTATATIAVIDNAPIAKNDSYAVTHGQTLTVPGNSNDVNYYSVLNNDTDADRDSLTASLVSNVQHGTLSFSPTGTFTYTPNAGFIGTDTFTYQDSDGLETSSIATVAIAVTENAPVARNDSYPIGHGRTLTIPGYSNGVYYYSVLNNDTDADGDSLTASLVSNVQHGSLSFASNGTFTYTPVAGFYGTDTFTYKAYDGLEWSTVATVSIAVTESPPIATNDSYSIAHGQTLTVPGYNNNNTIYYYSVLNNDTDADGDSLTASLVSNVQHGTLSFSPTGSFTYTPNAGFIGTDTFTYQDTDGLETSAVAMVAIAVTENSPVANNDSYSIAHGQVLSVTSTYYSLLHNDSDADGDSLTASLVSNVQHGTLSLSPNGLFTYTPAAGFSGTDTFTYKDYDGLAWSTLATVTIDVTESAPVAHNDSYATAHGQALTVPGYYNRVYYNGLLYNDSDVDGDSLTASVVSNVQHGTLSLSPNGTFTYTPTAGFIGTDTFTYKDYDGLEWSTLATVTIAVNENPPVAENDAYTITHGQTLTVPGSNNNNTVYYNSVLYNDSDADGDSLTASLVSNVQHGTLSFSPTGSFTYTPNAGFSGTDTFTYKDYDGMEWSTLATVTIAVAESPPIASNDSYTIAHGRVLYVPLTSNGILSNDTDADKDSLTASIVTGVQHGTLTFNPNGTFTYTPSAGFVGTDTFTYQDSDGLETSTIATVTIAVTENPPVARNDSYSVTHGQTLLATTVSGGVLGNDSDIDGDSLTASLVSNVQHGTLWFGSNGMFSYTPVSGFVGTDSFTYKDSDGTESSTVATVTIAVLESPPIAKNDTFSIAHGQTLTVSSTYSGVLGNDSDADRDSITASLVSSVQHGTLSFSPTGTFTYTPNAGFIGTDFFTYQDTDGLETSTIATVSIAVVENPPIAENDSYSIAHGQVLSVTATYSGVLDNDTDLERDTLTASLVSGVQHGTLSFNASGLFTYTPNAGFYGTDSFTYKAYDGMEWSGVATVSIAVTENPPIAQNDAYSVNYGQTLSVTSIYSSVLYNDSDPDHDPLTASLVSGVQHGTLSFNASGLFTYTPNAGFVGTDFFTYEAFDGLEYSSVATVSIAVSEARTRRQ